MENTHSTGSEKVFAFRFHDESRYSRVTLGSSFTQPETEGKSSIDGLRQLVAMVPADRGEWREKHTLCDVTVISQLAASEQKWSLTSEETITYPKRFRTTLIHPDGTNYSVEIKDTFEVVFSTPELPEYMPDAVFGIAVGAAAAMTEAKNYLLEALARNAADNSAAKEGWRSPRFSFTLTTASGSPFVERWAFAIQESIEAPKRFRVWVEQQRTGKELVLSMDDSGAILGLEKVEQLPAAVHGATVGMLLGMEFVVQRMRLAYQSGELGASSDEKSTPTTTLKCFTHENKEEAEAVLQQYVDEIKRRRDSADSNL